MNQRIMENGSPTLSYHVERWPWPDEIIHQTWRDVQREHFAARRRQKWSSRAWAVLVVILAVALWGWATA